MKIKLNVLFIICFVLVGCEDMNYEVNDKVQAFSKFSAILENEVAETRVHLENRNKAVWDYNDNIGVFSDVQDVQVFSLTTENGYSVFQGNEVKGNEFYAFYPYNENSYLDDSNRNLLYFKVNEGIWGPYQSRIPLESFMVAKSNNNHLAFKHTMGYIHIALTGTYTIKDYVNLWTNNGELLSGKGIVDLSAQEPILQIEDNEEASNFLTLWNPDDYLQLNENKPYDCYFPVPVGTYEKGITIQFSVIDLTTQEEIVIKKTTSNPVVIKRAAIVHFSAVDADAILTEEKETFIKERAALMDFFNATGGQNWTHNDNWGSDKPLDEWYGIYLQEEGHVAQLILEDNNLNGYLPENMGDLTYMWQLWIPNNNLIGKIPESFANYSRLVSLNLAHNQLSGEIPSSLGNLKQMDYAIFLDNNHLTGEIPESLGNLTNLRYLHLNDNDLTGVIPDSFITLSNLYSIQISNNRLNGILSEILTTSEWWANHSINLSQQNGYKLSFASLYESTDYTHDGEVTQILKHSKGKGCKIIITGVAFSDRQIANGRFKDVVELATEYFFSREPYTTFKDYFDVYSVAAVSKNEILGEDLAYDATFINNDFQFNPEKVYEYARKIKDLSPEDIEKASIMLIQNFRFGTGAYCLGNIGTWSTAEDAQGMEGSIIHEIGGHAFGKLADEYYDELEFPQDRKEWLDEQHSRKYCLNIDYNHDPQKVIWKDFINNPDYDIEGIGIYEGGDALYAKGVYRPSQVSIMGGTEAFYNAPSRWAIYQWIMDLAGENYSFQDFLEYDKKNLEWFKKHAEAIN